MLICSGSFNRLFKGMLAIGLSMLLTDGYAGPKYWSAQEGRVLDNDTGEPLAGVFVIARYWGDYPIPGHSSSACYHAASTTTDAQGEYKLPSRFDIVDIMVDKHSKLNFFKPGYRHVFYKDGIAKLGKEQGGRKERLEELTRIVRTNGCDGAGSTMQALFSYYEAIYSEVEALLAQKKDEKQLDWFRRMAARVGTASDSNLTHSEAEMLRKEFLEDHLQ